MDANSSYANSSSPARKPRRTVACDECKRRKVRCSAEPQCSNCRLDDKKCTYSTPQQRASALQRDVDHYERLLSTVRKTWNRHLPEVSLDQAIRNPDDQRASNQSNTSAPLNRATSFGSSNVVQSPSPSISEVTRSSSQLHVSPLDERDPESYEFDESQDLDRSIDGMAFMTSESRKSGYTGPQSGISALRFLRSLPLETRLDVANEGQPIDAIDEQRQMRSRAMSLVDVSSLIDDYFQLYHPCYPLLHEGRFRAQLSGAVPKPRDGSWPLLYNMVMAMGAFVGDESNSSIDLEYYRTARESISLSVLEKGSLSYLQGLMIMANYLQKRNKPNAGFTLAGIGWSMAMSIGLHREFSNTSTTPFTMEIRRRAWWTLFVLLSSAQLTVGRCPASLIGVTVQPPSNIRDIDLAVDMDRPAPEFDGPTVTSSLIAQLKLATIANEIQGELLTYQVPKSANAASLDDKISHWMAELPPYFNPKSTPPSWFEQPKFILLWRSYHLRIILNRPFLFQSVANDLDLDSDNQYVRSCLQTANICADSICDFFDTHTQYKRGFAWYATYWLITASFVHATCLAYAPVHSSAEQWKSQLKRAANVLGTLGSAHLMANRARRLLERLLDQYQSIGTTPQAIPNANVQARFEHSMMSYTFNMQQQMDNGYTHGPYDTVEESMPFDSAMDLSWLWSQGPNAEFLDAAGGITLQNYQNSWA